MARSKKEPLPTGIGRCRLCPRWENTKIVCMPGAGPTQPELVVIAESPSRVEDLWCRVCKREKTTLCEQRKHPIGEPLVGPSGVILQRALIAAGIHPDRVYKTNVVRCSGGNPTMIQVRKCRGYLLDELAALDWSRCRGVMILGQIALQGVLNRGQLRLRDARGRVLDEHGPLAPVVQAVEAARSDDQDGTPSHHSGSDELRVRLDSDPRLGGSLLGSGTGHSAVGTGTRLIPVPLRTTYHPAACLPHRNPGLFDEIVTDLKNLWKARDEVKSVTVVHTVDELDVLFHGSDNLALDLEWDGSNRIRMGGLSDGTRNAVTLDAETLIRFLASRAGRTNA